MNLKSTVFWESEYDIIRRDLGFDYVSDWIAATVLSEILQSMYGGRVQSLIARLHQFIRNSRVLVVGAYDTCVRCADVARSYDVIIAADGASLCCIRSGRTPDLIVTDLDGILGSTWLLGRHATLIVHAHGDNIGLLVKEVPKLTKQHYVVGTCQVRPPYPLHVFGGFTDGDRAAYLAYYFGASKLGFLGFNLEDDLIGRYSKPGGFNVMYSLKVRKLKWASRLLAYLRQACSEEGIEWVNEG